MPKNPEPTADLIQELREATREAHAALKDLHAAKKKAQEDIDRFTADFFHQVMKPILLSEFVNWRQQLQHILDEHANRAAAEFDRYINYLMEGLDTTMAPNGERAAQAMLERLGIEAPLPRLEPHPFEGATVNTGLTDEQIDAHNKKVMRGMGDRNMDQRWASG